MNKHLEQLANCAAELTRSRHANEGTKLLYDNASTDDLVRAIYIGPGRDRRRALP